jgi:putative transposase
VQVTKAHKILLYTTPELEATFVSWCGAARWAYNMGLERKITIHREGEKTPSLYTLMHEVVTLKKTDNNYAWLKDIPDSVPRLSLWHLELAYANFYRRVKGGATQKGFPCFKSKKKSKMAFHLENGTSIVNGNSVRIPKLGWIRMHQAIRFSGTLVGPVCISLRAGKWYASFSVKVEMPDPIENQEKVSSVGLDVGIKHLAILSDGKKFDNPRAFYHLEKLLRRAQRQMVHKHKDSHRKQDARLRVQRIHKRISDVRSNATHQASAYIANNYGRVALEDLNTAGMVRNRRMAKAILDANFCEMHRQLVYKMAWAGGEVRRVDRFFPSSKLCSACGCINNNLTLDDREWDCKCGAHHDRDVNAAINLATKCFGRGLTVTAREGTGVVRPTYEARTTPNNLVGIR